MSKQMCFISAYNLNSEGVATDLLYRINTQNMSNGSKTFTFTYSSNGRQYLSFAFYITNHTNPLATRFFTIDNFTVKFTGNYPFTETVALYDGKGYRYGFNGQECSDEVYGKGNLNTALFWEYDTRLGRRWNLDPVVQISISNYAAFRNNPILFVDPFGDEVDTKLDRSARKALGLTRKEARNTTPEMIKNMFAQEYGIGVEMKKGKLVYTGDVHTDNSVSSDARSMWINELKEGVKSEHKLLLTFGKSSVDVGYNVRTSKGSISTIDLGDFESDMRIKGDKYFNVPIRAHNLARVMEHEYLGHGVANKVDGYPSWGCGWGDEFTPEQAKKYTGETVDFTNRFNDQMGLPRRVNYGAQEGSFGNIPSVTHPRGTKVKRSKNSDIMPTFKINFTTGTVFTPYR